MRAGYSVNGLRLVVCCLAAVSAGCQFKRPDETARVAPFRIGDFARPVNEWMQPSGVSDAPDQVMRRVLQRGNKLSVILRPRGHGEPHRIDAVLEETGAITLPYIGSTRIAGLTSPEAEQFIRKRYAEEQIFQQLDVTVIAQEEEFFVSGEVQRPGKYSYTRRVTLLQAIAESGGYTPFANPSRVTVRRGDTNVLYDARRIKSGRDPDPLIQPGDVIMVAERMY